jgi:hypothetical protein
VLYLVVILFQQIIIVVLELLERLRPVTTHVDKSVLKVDDWKEQSGVATEEVDDDAGGLS